MYIVQSYLVEKAAQTMEVLMKLSMAVAYCGSFMAIRREPSLGVRFGGGLGIVQTIGRFDSTDNRGFGDLKTIGMLVIVKT